jgi:POT family proton-dependent oligopeptide transporter
MIGSLAARHPPGLSTLFFTEMWERCSYYGMRALLILFMTAAMQEGGLGLNDQVAGAIYGLYTAAVYLAALPGGWVADRWLGGQRAVWWGGLLIAAGQFTLAVPRRELFVPGLCLVVLGTGLLKPNVSAMVGQLYPEGGARRDAGFTIFYMGINLGATVGPLICGWLGEKINWRLGFAGAGVGMLFGLIQFQLTRARLGQAGLPLSPRPDRRRVAGALLPVGFALAAGAILAYSGQVRLEPVALAQGARWVIVGLAAVFFVYVLVWGRLTGLERKRVGVIALLFVVSALFWSGFEQAGSSFNLFAERYTARWILGWEVPAGWFQMCGPIFVVSLAPVAAAVWMGLARRGKEPGLLTKFGLGLALLGVGFLVMGLAARRALGSGPVLPIWLLSTYFMHTVAELCLSPVGLSAVTKLAPERFVGQMMGVWFLATSLGNLMAGLFAGAISGAAASSMPDGYMRLGLLACAAGAVLLAISRPVQRLIPR